MTTTLEEPARETLIQLRERAEQSKLPSPSERRAIRRRAGVSVAELASALHVSPAVIYFWESGQRNPSRGFRERYLEALGILEGEAA
jgi:DNA-binding transcriptional regulator YiaG